MSSKDWKDDSWNSLIQGRKISRWLGKDKIIQIGQRTDGTWYLTINYYAGLFPSRRPEVRYFKSERAALNFAKTYMRNH